MPVSLTPQQQQEVDKANAAIRSAEQSYNNAVGIYNTALTNFCAGYWRSLTDCDVKNAQSKFLTTTLTIVSIGTFGLPSIINNWTQKKWQKPTSCQDAIDKGILLSWDCDRGVGDCIKSETCNDKVRAYNAKLNEIYAAAPAVDGAKKILDQAKKNLEDLLAAIAKDPTTQGNIQEQIEGIKGEKRNEGIKWFLFGLIALVVTIGSVLLIVRLGKGKAATT